MAGTEVIDAPSLTRLAIEAFEYAGVSPADAEISARILVDADTMGLTTHGVLRLPGYIERIHLGGIDPRARVRIDRRATSLAVVDGNDALGPVVGGRALEAAVEMASDAGIAWVGCRRSNHFGALAPYALRACDAGLVLVAGTNASSTMIPWGGRETRMGNNPLCIAAPCADGMHFVLDMAMSVAARGRIRAAQAAGEPIPAGWAVDGAGAPTTDPAAALAGALLPIGGYKGSGLSLAVDVLAGVLSGARFLTDVASWSEAPESPSGLGHFFLLLDPARVLGAEAFAAAMARFKEIAAGTCPADGATPVLLPGEREQTRRRAALADGIELGTDLLDTIRALAGGRPRDP